MQQSLNPRLMTKPLTSHSKTAQAKALKEITRFSNRWTRRALIQATRDQMTSKRSKAEHQLQGHLKEEVTFTSEKLPTHRSPCWGGPRHRSHMDRYRLGCVNRLAQAERALAFSTLLRKVKSVSGHRGLQGATKRQGSIRQAASGCGLWALGHQLLNPR